MCENIHI